METTSRMEPFNIRGGNEEPWFFFREMIIDLHLDTLKLMEFEVVQLANASISDWRIR